MLEPLKIRNDKAGPKVCEALNKRHFEAYYVSTKEDAVKKILSLIPQNHTIAWGGSITMEQLSLKSVLKENNYTLIDRDNAKTPEEREELMHQALSCGTFIMSSNAITEDGQLFNIDGKGNRVAALCYGPKNVLIIAGMNKVVQDIDAAYSRVRGYAAPVNGQRFELKTPCKINGQCGDCISPDCICQQMVTTRMCKPEGRIKVVLVGEDLGI